MSWQVLIGISILFESFGRITQRVIMRERESDPIAPAVLYQLLAGLILGVLSFTSKFEIANITTLLPFLIAAPILWGVTNILIFNALKTTEASVFTILFATRTIFIILLSVVLLGETFTLQQSLGVGLILLAVVLISGKRQGFKIKRGEILTLLAAITIAVSLINDNYIVRTLPVLPYLAYNFLFSGLFVWIVNPKATKRITEITKDMKTFRNVVILACLFAVSAATAVLAYQVGRNSAQLGAIFPVSNILIVFLAIMFLKERSQLLFKIIAAILCFFGILLVA